MVHIVIREHRQWASHIPDHVLGTKFLVILEVLHKQADLNEEMNSCNLKVDCSCAMGFIVSPF